MGNRNTEILREKWNCDSGSEEKRKRGSKHDSRSNKLDWTVQR